MKTLPQRSKIVITSLLVFAVILLAGWLVSTERITIPGVTRSKQVEIKTSTTPACEQGAKVAQNNSECLFVGCNGFF